MGHLQQTDVTVVRGGLVVWVCDDSGDAEHLLCGLHSAQGMGPQHYQACPRVSVGENGWRM